MPSEISDISRNEKTSLWSKWNACGLIPGPEEEEKEFLERIEFCLDLQRNPPEIPLEFNEELSQALLSEILPETEKLYGIRPSWIPVYFGNYRLSPWHAGCAWIFQSEKHGLTGALIQLRTAMKNSPVYAGIYCRSEILIHETAHIGRMMYEEPKFEEFSAYRSSRSSIRRLLGPIVQSQYESLLFALSLFFAVTADLASFIFRSAIPPFGVFLPKSIPFFLIGYGLLRLFFRRRTYKKCLRNLEFLYSKEKADHLLYRLTDFEIYRFSRSTGSEIAAFIFDSGDGSFRWHFLSAIYRPYIKTSIK